MANQRERISRLTMMTSTGRSVLDPVSRLILAVDVEGSTLRTNLMKGELRRIMYALLYRALVPRGSTASTWSSRSTAARCPAAVPAG